jgi:hypothetical protein
MVRLSGENLTGTGAIVIGGNISNCNINTGPWTGELRKLKFDASLDSNFPTANENRPGSVSAAVYISY